MKPYFLCRNKTSEYSEIYCEQLTSEHFLLYNYRSSSLRGISQNIGRLLRQCRGPCRSVAMSKACLPLVTMNGLYGRTLAPEEGVVHACGDFLFVLASQTPICRNRCQNPWTAPSCRAKTPPKIGSLPGEWVWGGGGGGGPGFNSYVGSYTTLWGSIYRQDRTEHWAF
jgi:hypothetical protein